MTVFIHEQVVICAGGTVQYGVPAVVIARVAVLCAKCPEVTNCYAQNAFFMLKMRRSSFSAGLRLGPHWGSLQRFSGRPSQLRRRYSFSYPPKLWRLDFGAFDASIVSTASSCCTQEALFM